METTSEEKKSSQRIDTTLGDLIHAISEAAGEKTTDRKELHKLTQLVLSEMLTKQAIN